ncbi:MAG TPA: ABC transporter ATP-binding protein [Gemmataceae bacterium]|jgi:oligopeptide/dipeptide ABC transporter ATP-binding protein|nr:ABC transporter ATP-binding protein [Gemmataceae bacterium]
MAPLLEVCNLCVHIPTSAGLARAVDGISLQLESGQTLGIVGESGCGKSTLALALLRLHPPSTIVSGSIHFEGTSLVDVPEKQMGTIRGKGMALVFQESGAGLNPIYSLGRQIAEVVRIHQGVSRRSAWNRALEMLRAVQFPDPQRVARQYPHEVSGGMQQRVALALALAGRPRLLIADEPTSALDGTVRAEILELLRTLRTRLAMTLLLISHDLTVIEQMADAVAVMYAGKIVENGPAAQVLHHPMHPYTAALLACRPRPGQTGRLPTIEGTVPPATQYPKGCRFRDRCTLRSDVCLEEPPLEARRTNHQTACWHWEKIANPIG